MLFKRSNHVSLKILENEREERGGFSQALLMWRAGCSAASRRHHCFVVGHVAACMEESKQLLALPQRPARLYLNQADRSIIFFFSLAVGITHHRRSNSPPPLLLPPIPLARRIAYSLRADCTHQCCLYAPKLLWRGHLLRCRSPHHRGPLHRGQSSSELPFFCFLLLWTPYDAVIVIGLPFFPFHLRMQRDTPALPCSRRRVLARRRQPAPPCPHLC